MNPGQPYTRHAPYLLLLSLQSPQTKRFLTICLQVKLWGMEIWMCFLYRARKGFWAYLVILLVCFCFGPHPGMLWVYSWFYTPGRLSGDYRGSWGSNLDQSHTKQVSSPMVLFLQPQIGYLQVFFFVFPLPFCFFVGDHTLWYSGSDLRIHPWQVWGTLWNGDWTQVT